VEVVSAVAGALEALHHGGWVHGDVKAENILFGADDRAVLTDLGLAQHATGSSGTRGNCCGTPAYMAPELILGAASPDGRAVDQYALAVTTHLALTGELPFARNNSYATLFAHAQAPVPAVSATNPALAPFDPVLRRAMAKDPGARYASVREFAGALREALDDAP
jgi:serine/threonine-protein kinase